MKKMIIILFCIFSSLAHTYEQGLLKKQTTKQIKRLNDQNLYFQYVSTIFKWAQEVQRLMESKEGNESSRSNLDAQISAQTIDSITQDLGKFRNFLAAEKKNDLHKLYDDNDQEYEIIPDNISSYIRKFMYSKYMTAEEFIDAISGDPQRNKDGEWVVKKSLLNEIQDFDMNSWPPIKRFIDNFTATVFDDEEMASTIGNILHPFVKFYFMYLDNVSRARIFENLSLHWKRINLSNNPDTDLDILASRIFQNGGPVLVKFFQVLKEESKNKKDLPIKRVLQELKNIPPMDENIAIKLARDYVKQNTQYKKVIPHKNFVWGDYLAIASIGETHLVQIGEKKDKEDIVMKIHRDGINDIFHREVKSIKRMFNSQTSDEHFDKGLKHTIFNMIKGIEEELDFRYERRNIKLGLEAYNNKLKHPYLTTIDIPTLVNINESKVSRGESPYAHANQHVMVMTKALGVELNSILESSNAQEVLKTYNSMVKLYVDYFTLALDPKFRPNFYHGDLHGGNIFVDFDSIPDQARITLIDFGRAGELNPKKQDAMINIMLKTKEISKSRQDKKQNKTIISLANELEKFLLDEFEEPGAGYIGQVNTESLKSYFRVCFNPEILPAQRADTQSRLENKAAELKSIRDLMRKNSLPPQMEREVKVRLEKYKEMIKAKGGSLSSLSCQSSLKRLNPGYELLIKDLQDQIDFIHALNSHCLEAMESPLLIPLKNKDMLVSEKLKIVFIEMQKNGIAIPEDMIFFNKSKGLLEGIIRNLMNQLQDLNVAYKKVSVEEIFTSTIEKIRKSIIVESKQKRKLKFF